MSDFLVSIVIPVYNEGILICRNIHIIHDTLEVKGIKHEFILVDDGSKDNTWDALKELTKEIPKIKALKLSRNFGKEAALCAGLEVVRGDACVVMDADLQHPPEIIPEMVRLWHEEGYDIVEGVKTSRGEESIINKASATLFYRVLKSLTGYNLKNATDFKLMDKKVITAWLCMDETNTFFRGMTAWLGFKRVSIPFAVADRTNGKSKWSMLRLFKLAVTAFTSFSSLPLQIVTFIGIVFLILSIPISFEALYSKFIGQTVDGVTTIIIVLLIMGSAIMISLGIIGMYIAKIFDEVKRRPRYLLGEKIESTNVVENKNKIFIDA